ncbi:MAG: N-acetyltransferase [Sphingomonas bacterium]|uniref:GNAT family N-acetyltransferase n=1 Tax=Sphingomonas bacterium TaxID=1895847 RepID=UPI00261CAF91|nr:GNAT family N-acetyltransferase [Sphingomonas bacterium]MDB5695848.1 N-acetyltransferase [Sphingomonas bacterium]
MGLTPVAADRLATVVTTLEMRERPRPRPLPSSNLRLARWREPDCASYRALFRRVGGPWLWFSRLALSDEALLVKLRSPHAAIYAVVDREAVEVGMLELDFATPGEVELTYLALVPELTGQGYGRWLMAHALALGWRRGVERMHLNTCTLDHPSALGFYRAQGFVAVRRTIETFADPRAIGLLPPDAAPQVPLLVNRR